MIPEVRNALRGWMRTRSVKRITKTVVNHVPTESFETFTMKMMIQPMPPESVNRKSEEQRRWIWYTVWYMSGNELNIDDIITVEGRQYKIQTTTRWDESGYRSNDAIEYFNKTPVVLA